MRRAADTRLWSLLAVAFLTGCGDSSIGIRVVFPDEQSLEDARRLELSAVVDPDGSGCPEILGKRAAEVTGAVATRSITLPAVTKDLVLRDLPMAELAIGAVALDSSSRISHAGCAAIKARPGDAVVVVLTLIACPGGACTGCTSAADCPDNLDCDSGVCRCVASGRCQGCCQNNTCYPGTTTSRCGTAGGTCQACPSGTCASSSCVAGSCQTTASLDGLSCSGGVCRSGQCCTGCWDGKTCQQGNASSACGERGAACQDCDNTQPCKKGICLAGTCLATTSQPDGTSCPGGICHSGTCCTGCWSGTQCRTGTTLTQCGSGGVPCSACNPANLAECETASCATGSCLATSAANGTGCTGGACQQGICCTGCWDALPQLCRPGNTDDYCGDGGGACEDCTKSPGSSCSSGSCVGGQ